jgi:hypothetical protein
LRNRVIKKENTMIIGWLELFDENNNITKGEKGETTTALADRKRISTF